MQFGVRIDLDRAPVVLRQSRLLGLVMAGFGAGLVYLSLLLSPWPPVSLLCAAPALLILVVAVWSTFEGLRRAAFPRTLILDPTGLTIRDWRSERKLPWARIGNFAASKAGVIFDLSPSSLSDEKHPGAIGGYWILSGRLARVLTEARQRWAAGAGEIVAPEMSSRTKLLLIAVIVAVLGLLVWSKLAHPFTSCRGSGAGRPTQYAAAICPWAPLSPKETAWT